jgi:hypothetical protein
VAAVLFHHTFDRRGTSDLCVPWVGWLQVVGIVEAVARLGGSVSLELR